MSLRHPLKPDQVNQTRAVGPRASFSLGGNMPTLAKATKLMLILSLISLGFGAARAQSATDVQYLDGTSPLAAMPEPKQKPIGKLLVSAPVQILSQDGDWIEISMTGWTQAGAERVIYAAPGVRVLHAALSKTAIETLVFSERVEDVDTGLVWTQTEVRGWLKSPKLSRSLQDIWARAEPLFGERCTACHQRRVPHHYTANQWTSHLKIMGPRTGLPREDQFLIRAFLQYHAKDSDRLNGMSEPTH